MLKMTLLAVLVLFQTQAVTVFANDEDSNNDLPEFEQQAQANDEGDKDKDNDNAAAAQASIIAFLAEAKQHGLRCVRIVHGKGLRSKAQGPVLKQMTDTLLRRRADVLAFTSARPAQGGTGAVIVLLQRDA